MDLLASIARAFREYPDRPALVAADGACTYRELEGIVGGIAAELQSRGVGRRIGILTGDDLGTYASILAVLAIGAAYVPLNRKNPPARNSLIVDQAELDLVLASRPSKALEGLQRATARPIEALYTADIAQRTPLQWASPAPDDIAYLFFTSGTTGVPKGVPIRHRNLNAFATAVLDDPSYGFAAEDRFLQMFELTFDLSVMSLLGPLAVGASCHVLPDAGIASLQIARLLEERAITVALMVPSVLSYLRRYFDELQFPGAPAQPLLRGGFVALAHRGVVALPAGGANSQRVRTHGSDDLLHRVQVGCSILRGAEHQRHRADRTPATRDRDPGPGRWRYGRPGRYARRAMPDGCPSGDGVLEGSHPNASRVHGRGKRGHRLIAPVISR